MGAESIPKWVWGLLGLAAVITLIVLFATGIGEAAVIVAGLGWAATAIILTVLRAAGRDTGEQGEMASNERSSEGGRPPGGTSRC
jgi:hypothetical protein